MHIWVVIDKGFEYVIIEGHCSAVFKHLKGPIDDLAPDLRRLLLDGQALLEHIHMSDSSWVTRSANSEDQNLAKRLDNTNVLCFISQACLPTLLSSFLLCT